MTTGPHPPPQSLVASGQNEAVLRFLRLTARLLLEYSSRAEVLSREIRRVAEHLGLRVHTSVAYRDVTLVAEDGSSLHAQVRELRINAAVGADILTVLDAFCSDRIGLEEATRRLEALEHRGPERRRWVLAAIFGIAASALAWLLRADWGAIAVSGVSSGLGLIARQELGRRHVLFLIQPFAAALIGAGLGGLVILLGWTQTPGLCLIVPALMLVPGPHLINGVHDILENHVLAGMGRLGLAAGILLSAALGILLGRWLTLGMATVAATPSDAMSLTLPLDVTLAGLAALGFGAFYNAPWRLLWISIVCGMIGHGIRFICMEQAIGHGMATLYACLAIGVIAQIAADRRGLPFAAVAFAGAVPMMPGVFIYQGLGGAVRLSSAGMAADPAIAAATLALLFKAAVVVGAMVVGLLAGSRLAGLVSSRRT